MKRAVLMLVALLLTMPLLLRAQRVSEDELRIEIGDIEIESTNWDDIYPSMRRLRGVRQGGREEFLRIAIHFKIEDRRDRDRIRREGPPFISLMEVDWTVVAAMGREGPNDMRPEYSPRMTRTVQYANVQGDEENWVMIFIHPKTREQWLKDIPEDQIYFKVDFRYAGRTRATVWARGEDYTTEEDRAPGQTVNWIETERTLSVPYSLLHRYETPFGYASDDYLPRIVQQPEQR